MNRDCEKILGPCACGAWHVSEQEFEAETDGDAELSSQIGESNE